MIDDRTVGLKYQNPAMYQLRATGAGASVPTLVPFTSKGWVVTRTGVGLLTANVTETPFGVVQASSFWVNSSNNHKMVEQTPVAANSASFTLQVVWTANNVAVDLAANEELAGEVWTSRSGNP